MALHTEDTVFGVDVFSVSDGLVARKDTYLDWAAVQRQTSELAATPA